ncbi:MAG TPA: hypothetical protein VKE40_12340 [Gemmataceae bacterium]|nr:hypothetical protein [Gemmataceae bacterium]
MMVRLTPEARAYFDDYLADVRSAVVGHQSLSPDEIEQDVRDHVYSALDGAREPVSAPQVAAVLDRLGPPAQWVADEPRSVWKYLADKLKPVGHKAVEQIRSLPSDAYHVGRGLAARVRGLKHDWRLAYVTLGLLVLGMVFPPLLIASYFVARADVALARERGETLGARRWLVYPPLVIVSLVLFLALAAWPIGPAVGLSHQIPRSLWPDAGEIMHVTPRAVQPVSAVYLAVGAVSLWWGLASLLTLRFPGLPGLLFPPFGSRIRRIDALIVLFLSAAVFVVWLAKAETAWRVVNEVAWRM